MSTPKFPWNIYSRDFVMVHANLSVSGLPALVSHSSITGGMLRF